MSAVVHYPHGVQQLAYEEYCNYKEARYGSDVDILSFRDYQNIGISNSFNYSLTSQGLNFWRSIQMGEYRPFTDNYPDRDIRSFSKDFDVEGYGIMKSVKEVIKEGDEVMVSHDNRTFLSDYFFVSTDKNAGYKDKYKHCVQNEDGETSYWRYIKLAKPVEIPAAAEAK